MLHPLSVRQAPCRALLLFLLLLSQTVVRAQSPHTIGSFNGSTSDFNATEKSSAGNNVDYYVTYDDTYLYFGAFRTNNNAWGQFDHFNIYLDTDPTTTKTTGGNGSATGNTWDGATPGLPFLADYHIVIRPNNNGESFLNYWNGTSWSNGTTNGEGFQQYTSTSANGGLEVRIPRSAIGNPAGIYFTLHGSNTGGTFAGAPAAFSGGNLASHFGGIGLGSAGCSPTATTNLAIQGELVNGIPAAGVFYGRVRVSSGTVTAANSFGIAPGGILQVDAGATLDVSNRNVFLTPSGSVLANRGTTVQVDGTVIANGANTIFQTYSDVYLTGATASTTANWTVRRKLNLATGYTFANASILIMANPAASVSNAPSYSAGSSLYYSLGNNVVTRGPEWSSTSGPGYPYYVLINNFTILDAGGNGKTAVPLQVAGNMQIHGTSSMYMDYGSGDMTVPLVVNGNLLVNGNLSLSEAAGGDLQVKGNLTLNSATFTHNNRSITLNGTTAQLVNGTAANLNLYDLILNNSAGATFTQSLNVAHDLTTSSGKLTVNAGYTLTTNGTAYLNTNPSFGSTGTIAMAAGATLQINTGGWPGLTNTFSWGSNTTLRYAQNGGSYGIGGSDVYWSNTVYPTNIEVGSAGITLNAARTYPGTLTLNGPLTNTSTLTMASGGILRINSGGTVSNAPTYNTGSTLLYATGGAFSNGAEWSATSPWNVIVQGTGTNLTLAAGRTVSGNLTIGTGATFTCNASPSQNLFLLGDLTVDGSLVTNNKTVHFRGTGNQTIGSTVFTSLTLEHMGIQKTTGTVLLTRKLTITGYFFLNGGNISIGTNDFSFASLSGGSTSSYVVANSTGRVLRTVGSSAVAFPVGNSTYNPITLTNTGTLDIYGVRMTDAVSSPAPFAGTAKLVQRYWDVNEAVSGGSNLGVTVQWNTPGDEGSTFAGGMDGRIGLYNAGWTQKTVNTTSGTGTLGYSTTSAFALIGDNLTGGITLAAGKDDAFIQALPTLGNFTPATGYTGSLLTLTGTNFGGTTAVAVGGVPASFTVNSATGMTVSVPDNSTGSVQISTASGAASLPGFTWISGYATKAAGDYNTAASWLQGAVPPAGSAVVINHGMMVSTAAANAPATITISAGASIDFTGAAGALTTQELTNGGTLAFSGGGTLTFAGTSAFTNNGTFSGGSGTVAFTGTATVSGTQPTPFNIISAPSGSVSFTGAATQSVAGAASFGTLEVNKVGGTTTLSSATSVSTKLYLTNGTLDLGAFDLTVSKAAIAGEGSASSYVKTSGTGQLKVTGVGPADNLLLPVGNSTYNPIRVSSGAGQTLDWAVRVDDQVRNVTGTSPEGYVYNTSAAIQRQWDITPYASGVAQTDLTQPATVRFYYDGTSDAGPAFATTQPNQLWHYNGFWFKEGAPNTVQSEGGLYFVDGALTKFSPYSISNVGSPLPVQMLSFSGRRAGGANELKWTTLTEHNNGGFYVERSADGRTFAEIGFVRSQAAGGNSPGELRYAFTDNNTAGAGWYYRLRQTDFDGRIKYSSVISMRADRSDVLAIEGLYPNPTRDAVQARLQAGATNGNILLQLTDMTGKVVKVKSVSTTAGASTTVALDLNGLVSGVYHLKAVSEGEVSETVKVVKN